MLIPHVKPGHLLITLNMLFVNVAFTVNISMNKQDKEFQFIFFIIKINAGTLLLF